tara:strand:- start:439 stop:603 length:165 start_codon:yes stop_codon:yes gene_type:complete
MIGPLWRDNLVHYEFVADLIEDIEKNADKFGASERVISRLKGLRDEVRWRKSPF